MIKRIALLSLMTALLILSGCISDENPPTITTVYPPIKPGTYTPPSRPVTPGTKKIPTTGSMKGKVIVVDAGHGGDDPGTMGSGLPTMPEKSINLSIANELARQLKAKGAKVVMTRSNDTFITLEERAAIARRNNADLFVAVHTNSNPHKDRRGAVVYCSRSPSHQSMVAAMMIERAIENAKIPTIADRGDYKVLVLHSRPSVLVECGYVTNYTDCKLLNTSAYRTKIATAITQGISSYFAR